MKITLFFCLWIIGLGSLFAQDTISNPNSIEKIPYYEQLWRFRVNRVIDLNEKQNAGFNSRKSSIANLIIDLLGEGKLHTYGDTKGDPADFKDNLADTIALNLGANIDRSQTQGNWDGNRSYQAGEQVIFANEKGKMTVYRTRNEVLAPVTGKKGEKPTPNQNPLQNTTNWEEIGQLNNELSPQNIVGLELIEDVIFDRRRSRLYYDILAFGIVLEDPQNLEKLSYRFYISYKELMKEISRLAHSKDLNERQRVMWQNRYNPSEGKTFADAFKLRLFHGVIRKVENPDDYTIQKMYEANGRSYSESVFARWEEEMILMEKEHNLWEY
ncbi:MAG: hypothetical protein HYR67_10225 [Bacteroidetes bacterium]|nr:hypothetical protein [Bacteroidota bacterium]